MNRLTILTTILIIALSAIVLYYVIRFNNIKNLLGVESQGLVPVKLEDRILTLKNCAASYDNLEAGLEAIGALDFPDTEEMPVDVIRPFLENFRNSRHSLDVTETILFDWPLIIQAMKQTYGFNANQWDDLTYWADKAFIIYPANYGASGYPAGQNRHQSTAIFQLARKDASTPNPNDWEAILNANNKVYNFGDLQPPKGTIR